MIKAWSLPPNTGPGSWRTRLRAPIGLATIVLLVHLCVAWISRDGIIQDDADSYVRLGHNLAAGHGFVFEPGQPPTSWRAPGYPYYLALIFRIVGEDPQAARMTHALAWLFAAWMTTRIARTFGAHPDTALVSGALVGLYPEFIGLTGLLWSENLFVPIFLASTWAVLASVHRGGPILAVIGTGLLLGVTFLTRSTALVLIPVVFFAGYDALDRRNGLRRASIAALVALGILGAWTWRNWRLHGRFILVESNMGLNLFVGNTPDTPIPFAWRKLATLPGDERYQELVRGRSEGERNAALSRAALEYIRNHPFRTAGRALAKAFDFWLPDFFVARNVKAGSFGRRWTPLWTPVLLVTAASFVLVSVAALRTAIGSPRSFATRVICLVLFLYTLPHMLVYGASRYHLPLIPLIVVLATPEVLRWAGNGRRGSLVPS